MAGTRILKTLGVIVGVVVVAAVLALWLWDFSRYKTDIETAVSNGLGREFRIEGPFDIDVLPSPAVLIDGASLANADWSDEPEMAAVGHAYVRLGLWSLLFGPVVVKDLELSGVNILLQENATGETNWDFSVDGEPDEEEPDDEEPDDADETGRGADLRAVTVSDVTVTYRKPDAEPVIASIDSFVLTSDEDDRKQINGTAQWSDLPIDISGIIADRQSDIDASFGNVRISAVTQKPEDSLDFTLSIGSLDELGKLIEVDNLPVEDATLTGNLLMRDDTLVLSNIVAKVSGLEVTLDGEVGSTEGIARLSIDARGERLAYLNAGLPDLPFAAEADLVLAEQGIDVDPFTISFGDSRLTGALSTEGGDTPSLRLQAQSELIDLSPFSSDDTGTDESTDDADSTPESPYVFTEEPLPLELLGELDADIGVEIAILKLASTQFENLSLAATVKDGVLEAENRFAGQFGGTYENRLTLSATGDPAQLQMITDVRDLRLGLLSGGDIAEDEMPATTVDIDIRASGNTPRALASSADGRFVVTQGPGKVDNGVFNRLSGDIIAQLFNALNPFADKDPYSQWECSVFAIDFESGVGEITGFLLESDKLKIVGGGKIDLNTEELRIEFNTKPRTGVGISADMFVTPFVALTGTLARPAVGLNAKGALLSGGAGVLTGGLSFLYQGLLDRATGEISQCAEAMESVRATVESEDAQ